MRKNFDRFFVYQKTRLLSGVILLGLILAPAVTAAASPRLKAPGTDPLSKEFTTILSGRTVIETLPKAPKPKPIAQAKAAPAPTAAPAAPAPAAPPAVDGLVGSIGYALPYGNCVNEPGVNNPGYGNPSGWPALTETPTIGATFLMYENHTGVVTGIWSNGDIEVRHQNWYGGQHRFPRSMFRGFR